MRKMVSACVGSNMTPSEPSTDPKLGREDLDEFTRRVEQIRQRLHEGTLLLPQVLAGLRDIFEGRPLQLKFPVWKTIKLGTQRSPDAYQTAMENSGMKIGSWAQEILEKVDVSSMEINIDLVNTSVGELGFMDGADYSAICERALEVGLELCPAEVGPALRLICSAQAKGEWLAIAMKALPGASGYER